MMYTVLRNIHIFLGEGITQRVRPGLEERKRGVPVNKRRKLIKVAAPFHAHIFLGTATRQISHQLFANHFPEEELELLDIKVLNHERWGGKVRDLTTMRHLRANSLQRIKETADSEVGPPAPVRSGLQLLRIILNEPHEGKNGFTRHCHLRVGPGRIREDHHHHLWRPLRTPSAPNSADGRRTKPFEGYQPRASQRQRGRIAELRTHLAGESSFAKSPSCQ